MNWQFYQDQFKLRVMTFDSCQGDEKDIIYYSMVEKPNEDILKYIFPVRLAHLDEEEDGNLKAQRLNVGFSRARESVRFVVSKPIAEIKGEVGKALQSYSRHLEAQDTYEIGKRTDPHSAMEKLMLSLITQTEFYKTNVDRIEIVPQFDIGKYIKQLDRTAQIPNYRSDFLLIYRPESGKSQMVILEYDGFEFHFKDNSTVDETNFDKFYIEEDVERRKTIESYGYPTIRLNKFLLKDGPIEFLNSKLEECCKKKTLSDSLLISASTSYDQIENGKLKLCPKCGKYKDIAEFYDDSLKRGIGRLCGSCKGRGWRRTIVTSPVAAPAQKVPEFLCPRCNSKMVLRDGKHGKFYGCSTFPLCRGTRKIK